VHVIRNSSCALYSGSCLEGSSGGHAKRRDAVGSAKGDARLSKAINVGSSNFEISSVASHLLLNESQRIKAQLVAHDKK
jgi:hypothetical protein